jgi:hypothetical protein
MVAGCDEVDHNATDTSLEIKQVALLVSKFISEKNSIPGMRSLDASNRLDATSVYREIESASASWGSTNWVATLDTHQTWSSNGTFADRWGRKLVFLLAKGVAPTGMPSSDGSILIWSVGQNGKDEAGHGDDIGPEVVGGVTH